MKTMNVFELEKRFVDLHIKARFVELTNEEVEEVEQIKKQLNIESCDTCKGYGYFEVPSMMGYGWECYPCKICKGHGLKNVTPYIHEQLKEMD
jgi:DnaJ-class molecular chaperone